jgi:hypothetical protein
VESAGAQHPAYATQELQVQQMNLQQRDTPKLYPLRFETSGLRFELVDVLEVDLAPLAPETNREIRLARQTENKLFITIVEQARHRRIPLVNARNRRRLCFPQGLPELNQVS